jgi:hypothetical protein
MLLFYSISDDAIIADPPIAYEVCVKRKEH